MNRPGRWIFSSNNYYSATVPQLLYHSTKIKSDIVMKALTMALITESFPDESWIHVYTDVSVIHQTRTWTTRSLTCVHDRSYACRIHMGTGHTNSENQRVPLIKHLKINFKLSPILKGTGGFSPPILRDTNFWLDVQFWTFFWLIIALWKAIITMDTYFISNTQSTTDTNWIPHMSNKLIF